MTYRPNLAAQITPAIMALDAAAVNRMAVVAAYDGYSDADWADTFIHVLRSADEDVWHFWMEERCPCEDDPYFHFPRR